MTEHPLPRPGHPSPESGRPPGQRGDPDERRVDNEDWAKRHWDVTDSAGLPVTDVHQLLLPGDDPVQMARTVLRSPAAAGAPPQLLEQCRRLLDTAGDNTPPDGEHRSHRGQFPVPPADAAPAARVGDVAPGR